jgi:hypothetical protein
MQAAQNNNYDLIGLGVATFALALGGIDVALKGGLGQLNREPLRRRGLGIAWAYIVLIVGLPIAAVIMLVAG